MLTTVKFNKTDLERIRIGENTVEECVAEKLSFQRPHHIIDNFENLDIGRVSYLFLRVFNIERIDEGTVDYMVLSGVMLKLIERAEALKKD